MCARIHVLNELSANKLVLAWNAYGVDVKAIAMLCGVNDCSLSLSSPCAANANTTAIAANAAAVIAVIQVGY